jgi:hypothetical protein
MNFFTLNSRRPGSFWITLAVALGLLYSVDTLIHFYIVRKTTLLQFIDNKESKFIHLALQRHDVPFDAIFIGSSYTKNHVSTASFAERGFRVYNLGISGRLLGDFPSMTIAANSHHPKFIVLNISLDELFVPPSTKFVHPDDLGPLIASSTNLTTKAEHAWSFFLSLHSLHYYREAIYLQFRDFLSRLTPQINSPKLTTFTSKINYSDQEKIGVDCDVFKTTIHEKMKVVTCTNGDGAQLGHIDQQSPKQPLSFNARKMNPDALALLNNVIASSKGKAQVVVVLQPMWGRIVKVDFTELQAQIQAPVLDLTSATFSDHDWCDEAHFNIFGRSLYSKLLADRLSTFLRSSS